MAQTFGEALKECRRAAGVTQRELASKVGVDFSYISKVENDRIPPPAADTIVKMCVILEVEPGELLALTGKLPSDIQTELSKNKVAQEFLRAAHRMDLSDEEWAEMLNSLHGLRGSDGE